MLVMNFVIIQENNCTLKQLDPQAPKVNIIDRKIDIFSPPFSCIWWSQGRVSGMDLAQSFPANPLFFEVPALVAAANFTVQYETSKTRLFW